MSNDVDEQIRVLEADVAEYMAGWDDLDAALPRHRHRAVLLVAYILATSWGQRVQAQREALAAVLPYFNGTDHPGELDDLVRAARGKES